jgi:hypothetical protein
MHEDDSRRISGLERLKGGSVEVPDLAGACGSSHHDCHGGQGIEGSHGTTSCLNDETAPAKEANRRSGRRGQATVGEFVRTSSTVTGDYF